jgi:hypothetical protein
MLPFALLLACQTSSPALPIAPPPPPLTVSTLVATAQADLDVDTGLGAGVVVWAVGGAGRPTAGPCPPVLGGLCVSIRNPRLLTSAVTDAAGHASLRVTMPNTDGLLVTLQVVRPDALAPWVSSTATARILAAIGDEDSDGLNNRSEVRVHTDVYTADSDGGGTLDGQEVRYDRTDPLAAGDDVHIEHRCADNGLDDDSDGLTDCADPDCALFCPEARCADGLDDDSDGLVDCHDLDCPACAEDCANGVDDDRDGLADCDDLDCPVCPEVCTNGIDDDRDRLVDNFDADCGEACDALDRDRDGLVGCFDPDCACAETCGNGVDDDQDLLADCLDPDCGCVEQCTNEVDDDRDGLADCADPDCGLACGEDCDNGADDDGDGLVDCEDGGCTDRCTEDCHNGVDDNGDDWVDCQDDGCWDDPTCPAAERAAWVVGGRLHTERQTVVEMASTFCANSRVASSTALADDVVGRVRVDHDGRTQTCEWRVDHAAFHEANGWYSRAVFFSFPTYYGGPGDAWTSCTRVDFDRHDATRQGFRVEPGCGLTGSDFLPERLKGDVHPFVARNLAGDPWYRGRSSVTQIDTNFGGGGGPGDEYSLIVGSALPLQPVTAFGVCPVGAPTLVADPAALWGLSGVCLP